MRALALGQEIHVARERVQAIGVQHNGQIGVGDGAAHKLLRFRMRAHTRSNRQNGLTMQGCGEATQADGSGIASVTRPAPPRRAACPASTAAPVLPTDPATSSTWPYEPLWDSAARTNGKPANSSAPAQRTCDFPISSTSAAGEPINRTTNCPQHPASGEVNWPILGAVNV